MTSSLAIRGGRVIDPANGLDAVANVLIVDGGAAAIEFVLRTARSEGAVRVLPIGCVTKGRQGKELAELAELADAGAVAFSDGGSPVVDPPPMGRAPGEGPVPR